VFLELAKSLFRKNCTLRHGIETAFFIAKVCVPYIDEIIHNSLYPCHCFYLHITELFIGQN
jgi:hypothetical protein